VGQLREVQPLVRSTSGFVRSLLVSGSLGQAEISGDQIRSAIKGLKSNLFYVETRRDAHGTPVEFLFHGGGWGHGVGFCQAGSAGRARAGQEAPEILHAYFPEAKVTRRYE
jgi:SpoIID/LytB domain protein